MMKSTCWSVLIGLALATASATDFPLEFKSIPITEAMTFGGSSGPMGQIRLRQPAEVKKEPKAISKTPLYGRIGDMSGETTSYIAFRLDESKGTGKGYDLLIVDINQNGDLTDDPIVKRYTPLLSGRTSSSTREQVLFGPVAAPRAKLIGKSQPFYFAQAYISTPDLTRLKAQSDAYLGYLRLKAGWYLETTIAMNGVKQKLALYDANSNMRLGEPWKPTTYRGSDNQENWYFRPGDNFLVDSDGSGKFEANEAFSFGPILYLTDKAYQVTLPSDCNYIQLTPWTEPLAELDLRPQGDQLASVLLAWQKADQWQLIKPGISNGRVLVPPGKYRLYSCVLAPKADVREQVRATGFKRAINDPILVKKEGPNTLLCGAPLQIQVTTTRGRFPEVVYTTDAKGNRVGSTVKSADSDMVRINGLVTGAGGEVYSSYGKGKDFQGNPPKPTFMIADAKGKQLASGNLEFG